MAEKKEWKSGFDEIADKVIAAMEKGETPWQKPWSAQAMNPVNPTTGKPYRGGNRIALALEGMPDARWMTYRQAAEAGWQVRKGEKGVTVIKLVEKRFSKGADKDESGSEIEGTGKTGSYLVEKRYTVFNASQIDGIPPLEAEKPLDFSPAERGEALMQALVERTGLRIEHGGAQAFYSPSRDMIQMPHPETFHSIYQYYATGLHEASHSTLHAKRLDRKEALGKQFGDQAYALEELRAEIASCFLASQIPGLQLGEDHLQNHASYLNSWIKALQNDKKEIIRACADAEKICAYIIDNELEHRKEKEAAKALGPEKPAEKAAQTVAAPAPKVPEAVAVRARAKSAGMGMGA